MNVYFNTSDVKQREIPYVTEQECAYYKKLVLVGKSERKFVYA